MTLCIRKYPDPVLTTPAQPVTDFAAARALAADLAALLPTHTAAGLAAPQVGVGVRLFVTRDRAWVNPELRHASSDEFAAKEGCLSLPGIEVVVRRPYRIEVAGYDVDGLLTTLTLTGYAARVWQHEYDHINGITLLDHLPAERREELRHQLKKLRRYAERRLEVPAGGRPR